MKSTESVSKFRDMTADELQNRDVEFDEQMFRLRFQLAMGQTESLNKLRQLRKDRARLLTILREKTNG